VNAGFALSVLFYAGHRLNLSVTLAQILGYLLLVCASLLVHYSLLTMLSASSFWTVRAQGVIWGYYNLFNIARLPDSAFRGFFRAFFTFAIPMLLVTNVPVKLIVQRLDSLWEIGLLLALGGLCFILSEMVWRF